MSQLPPAQLESPETCDTPAVKDASAPPSPDAAKDGSAVCNGTPRRRRRWLIASLVLVIAVPSAWGGYRWMFPPVLESGPSDVHIVRTGDDSGEAFVPVVEVAGGHPIDPALDIAREGLEHIRRDVRDYTARLVKRERVGGKLGAEETMQVKIRNRKVEGDRLVRSLRRLHAIRKAGRGEGPRGDLGGKARNDGCLIAHEGSGLVKAYRAYLPPEHKWAMAGNRYPITHIGLENLIEQLIERGTRQRQHEDCEVRIVDDAELNGRPCRRIELRHPEKSPEYDFSWRRSISTKNTFCRFATQPIPGRKRKGAIRCWKKNTPTLT